MNYYFFTKNLPNELTTLITEYCCPETDYYRDKILLIANTKGINRNGFNTRDERWRSSTVDTKASVHNIMRCIEEIPAIIRPLRTAYILGSYGAKHSIEYYREKCLKVKDGYISNGEFIIAMIMLGHEYKRPDDSLNAVFRAGYLPRRLMPKGYDRR